MGVAALPYFHDGAPGVGAHGKSWSGAGVAGANADRSWSGHGTANATLYIADDINGGSFSELNSQCGCYVYLSPGASDGCVWSILTPTHGGWSAWITAAGHFISKAVIFGVTYQIDISGFDFGHWNWVTAGFQPETNSGSLALSGILYGAGNVQKGATYATAGLPAPYHNSAQTIASSLGDGTDLNGFSADMFDDNNNRRSKLVISKGSGNAQTPPYGLLLRPPPWNDATVPLGSADYYYLGRQTPGVVSSITESGAGVNNLSGSYGHVYGDGPFAS